MTIDDLDLPADVLAKAGHLIDKLRGKPLPQPTGWHVLVLQYIRPDAITTASGMKLYTAPTMQREDEYQGRCGLVLALGPDAYGDQVKFGSGPWCKVGDWVSWRNMESAASRITYAGTTIARLADDTIVDVGIDPALVS